MNFINKIMGYLMKFVNTRPIVALKDGFLFTMPLTIIGSLFLLIGNLPINGYSDFMAGIFGSNWNIPLEQVTGGTYDMLALIAAFGIAYSFTKNENIDGVPAGILAIVSFCIVAKSKIMVADQTISALPREFTGSKGVIAAILLGIMVGYVYTFLVKHDIRIKMPEGVPTGVANAFTSLIPGLCITLISFIIFIIFQVAFETTFIEQIYTTLQTPLQNLLNSPIAVILIPLLISLFWWFGVHGSNVVGGIISPILMASSMANQAIIDQGIALIPGENAVIITDQFYSQFITFTGCGITMGLVINMFILSKSKQFKQLGRLSLVPACFNINELVIFGLPIVLNPLMLVPYILVPVLSSIITFTAIKTGIMQPFGGVMVPWTTPPIISGLLVGGWKAAVLQVIVIILSTVIYHPFFKALDKQAAAIENGN